MSLIKLALLLFFLSVSSPITAASNAQDAELMLNRLLHTDNEKYNIKNEKGQFLYNSLLEHKDWERLYIKYSKLNIKNKKYSETEIKNLLFIGFIAKINLDAAISESLSSDLVPIFNKNKILILNILSDLKFLVPSTCYYLNNYFGFEGRNIEKKSPFIKKNKQTIMKYLGKTDGKKCISYLHQNKYSNN